MSSTHSFHSNCGCLHSEETSVLGKITENFPEDLQFKNKSKTCLQNVSNTDSLKTIFLSKESIYVEKLNTLRKRMLISLSGIQNLLGDRPQADGVEDLMRREQRAAEFSSRFGRNYLYPLQRQMNTIAKMWKNLQINHTRSAFITLCQKVIATHQIAQAALKAYLHHIPSSVEKGIPEKLEELLQLVHNLCSVCSMLGMSEEDSDFNSEKVKQQCQMLIMLIKNEVSSDEGGDSCTALSRICLQKETVSNSKKGSSIHRFSMYSRNTMHKLSNHQNNKSARISVAPKKISSKLHPKKQTVKEFNKPIDSKVSTKFSVPLKRINSKNLAPSSQKERERVDGKKTGSSFQKELEKINTKQSVSPPDTPSMSTLRKLESEIKNLKKHAKYLKEIGHPNYPIYLEALDVMSHQLTGMKERLIHSKKQCRQVSNTSHLYKTKEIKITQGVRDSLHRSNTSSKDKFPKNVKLICLSRMSDNESTHEQKEFLESRTESIDVADSVLQEVCEYDLTVDKCQEMEKVREEFQESEPNERNRKSQDTGSIYKTSKRNCIMKFLTEFSKMHSEESTLHLHDHLCHNSCIQVITNDKELNNCKTIDSREGVKMTLSQSETQSVVAYRQAFQKYMNSSSLYEESIRPWMIVERLANNLMENILKEILLNDIGIQNITAGLLQLEFQ